MGEVVKLDPRLLLHCERCERCGVDYPESMDDHEKKCAPEVLKYALQMSGMDFGAMIARNQFVRLVINPLMDSVSDKLKRDHVTDSETKYTLKLIIESERQRGKA